MEKGLTAKQLLFSIGIYEALEAAEKFSLLVELVEEYVAIDKKPAILRSRISKKLSSEKKASFLSFLKTLDIEAAMHQYTEENIYWIDFFSEAYPEALKEIYAPPVVLFYKGNIQWLKQVTWLGVVGAREYSPYGKQVVQHLLSDLHVKSNGQIGIVSGLAKGIDTQAHVETIKNKGKTVGVIGSGLDSYYPYNNRSLQQLMSQQHLVLSEYPIGSKPLKHHFPERNRIIAGLSRGILVIESKKRSGSLITAYNALDEGRDVFAVPGSIFEDNREGNHRLIQLGAVLTKSSEDILKEWFII